MVIFMGDKVCFCIIEHLNKKIMIFDTPVKGECSAHEP